MASLIDRADRATYIVQTADNRQRSLGIKKTEPGARRRALAEVARITADELATPAPVKAGEWHRWVPAFIDSHYQNPRTLHRSRHFWNALSGYFAARRITSPAAVTYQDASAYLEWRQAPPTPGARTACHNTALEEVKFLSFLLTEAVRRGHISANPVLAFRRRPHPRAVKSELTDPQIIAIRHALALQPEIYARTFEICLHQGCRLSEASIHLPTQVDTARWHLSFPRTKTSPFTTVVHPGLQGWIHRLKDAGEERTCPPLTPAQNITLNRILKRATGDPRISIHSTRVTLITRLHRLEWPEQKVRRAVNHAGSLIHQVYVRLGPDDLFRGGSETQPPNIRGWPCYAHLDPPAWLSAVPLIPCQPGPM